MRTAFFAVLICLACLPASFAGKVSPLHIKLTAFNTALNKNPDDAAARLGRAELYLDIGETGKAEKDFVKLTTAPSGSAAAYAGLGQVRMRQNRYDEAVSCFTFEVNRSSATARYYYLRATAYAALENYPRAVHNSGRAMNFAPGIGIYPHKRGIYNARMGAYREAVKDYTTAIELDKKDPIVRNNRAAAYLRLGKWEEARTDAQTALRLEKNFPAAYINLAAYWWTGKKNSKLALENISSALRVGFRDTKELYDEKEAGYFFRGLNRTPAFERIVSRYR